MDGSKSWDASPTNAYTKIAFLEGTEHSFRVRAVRGSSVSEWSDVVKEKTQKESFEASRWKKCPDDVNLNRKYSVNEKNLRIAKKISGNWCTIIGNIPLPLNTVTSWSIKVLESMNDGNGIYIGVAPSDIDQNENDNTNKSGWYFYCCD